MLIDANKLNVLSGFKILIDAIISCKLIQFCKLNQIQTSLATILHFQKGTIKDLFIRKISLISMYLCAFLLNTSRNQTSARKTSAPSSIGQPTETRT